METTLRKRLSGKKMIALFDRPDLLYVKSFKMNYKSAIINPGVECSFVYDIIVRHNECEDAEYLFKAALLKL